jgi:hypothetical protein
MTKPVKAKAKTKKHNKTTEGKRKILPRANMELAHGEKKLVQKMLLNCNYTRTYDQLKKLRSKLTKTERVPLSME